jgi:hypothetical protein
LKGRPLPTAPPSDLACPSGILRRAL